MSRAPGYCLALAVCLAALNCGPAVRYRDLPAGHQTDTIGNEEAGEFALSEKQLRSVIEEVTAARGLPLSPPVKIEQLPVATFRARLRKQDEAKQAGAEQRLQGLRMAFEWRPPARDADTVGTKLEEVVAAYYDGERDRIVLPFLQASDSLDHHRNVFAHEVHHAVQHRTFPIKAMRANSNEEDAALALLSLTEGDAQLAMAAYIGRKRGIPLNRIVRRATDIVSRIPVSSHHKHDQLMSTGAHTSSLLNFPYLEGMRFVGDLYRTGGYELVNAAYRSPPTSSSHILHPQRYLAGKLPDDIAPIAVPASHRKVLAGRWGELRTRAVLQQCSSANAAAAAADGWQGDRYLISVDPQGHHQFQWLVTFNTPKAAIAFANLLQNGRCKAAGRQRYKGSRASFWVRPRGRRVAVVRGLARIPAMAMASQLLKLSVAPAWRTALSTKPVPTRAPIAPRAKGHLSPQGFTSYWLGLQFPQLADSEAVIPENLELAVETEEARGLVALFDFVPSGSSLDNLFATVRTIVEDATGRNTLSTTEHRYKGPLGDTIIRRWRSGSAVLSVRVVPVCALTGAVVIITLSAGQQASTAIEDWADSPSWLAGRRIPACRWLDPR